MATQITLLRSMRTGQLKVAKNNILDKEQSPYTSTVTAADPEDEMSASITVEVTVSDVNEPPTIDSSLQRALMKSPLSVL